MITAPVEFSVLTPGLEGRFQVFTAVDVLAIVGLGNYVDHERTKALRKLVESDDYYPGRPIADAILAALHDAGRSGTHEPITRPPAGHLQSLAADELPPDPKGAVLLDVTINWIGLHGNTTGDKLRPAFSLTWRLISPDRKLIAPGRELRYIHEPQRKKSAVVDPALHSRAAAAPAAPQPEPVTQEFCSIRSVKAAQEEPSALWECFDEAYLAAARKLVEQLPKPH
ncbi:MAG: hypothetical protein HW417_1169 [Steroidobacteraceae bacterium]|nr:hypothetical protein [Steroidobacteraceae bacterium]